MQGQRSTIDSFSGSIDIEQGSMSNNTGMSEQASWFNMLNPVEGHLSNVASSETACTSGILHDVERVSGWDIGESSRMNIQNQGNDDEMKLEHGWTPSSNAHVGADPRSEERRVEETNIIFSGSDTTIFSGNLVPRRTSQSSGSGYIPQNLNQNAGFAGNSSNSGQGTGAGLCPNLYKPGGLETDLMSSDNIGSSSGISAGNNGASSSTLGAWGLSGKRKTIEGSSGQSYAGGSSSSTPQAENGLWLTGPAHQNAPSSLSLSTSPWNSPSINCPERIGPRIAMGMRPTDVFPSSSITRNAESSLRNYGRRESDGNQQESAPFSLSLTGNPRHSSTSSSHQSRRHLSLADFLDPRVAVIGSSNSSVSQSQSHAVHVSGLSRDVHPFSLNGASTTRVSSSSSSLLSGERSAALREESGSRINTRNNLEHPMFVTAADTRNLAQDPTSWSLGIGHASTSAGVSPNARLIPAPSVHPVPIHTFTPRTPPVQSQQRLSEYSPWTLFPSLGSETGGPGGRFPPFPSGPSTSSQERATSSGDNSQENPQPYVRPALLMERQNVDALGMPQSLHALAVGIEGRHRLISEIRQVLNAMRRGENLRAEDYTLFDPFIYPGMVEMHIPDRHRDMRLDVDNMSYEELLALGERIGDVSTGLSEEAILKVMKQHAHECHRDLEPCCICREEYDDGDYLGTLDCGHQFHSNCIKQWLIQKNLCPICKTAGLST